MLAGNDLDHQLAPDGARRIEDAQQLALLTHLQIVRVVGVIEAQALDRLDDRPFDEVGAEVAAALEVERTRARLFDRPADPERVAGGSGKRPHAIGAVDEHAEARLALGDAGGRSDGEFLETADLLARRADAIGDRLELAAMVDGKRHQRVGLRTARLLPMDGVHRNVLARNARRRLAGDEGLQFLERRIFRRAQEARHGDGAAGIGPGAGRLDRRVLQPAAQETGHEGVAGAERIVDVDRETGTADAVIEALRDRARIDETAHRPLLEHDRCGGHFADAADRFQHGLAAAGDHQFFLGADDQVDGAHHLVETPGHGLGADIAVVAGLVAGQPPQVGAVVDIEDDLAAGGLGRADRLVARRLDGRRREMRAADEDGAGRGDIGFVDVVLRERHVGAIGAIEDVRLRALVAHAENHERRQPLRIGDNAIDGNALADELLADEAPHMLGADTGDDAGLEAKARRADGGVGGAAAHRLGEGRHVLKPSADLLSVKVHGRPADGDDIEASRGGHRRAFIVAHRSFLRGGIRSG